MVVGDLVGDIMKMDLRLRPWPFQALLHGDGEHGHEELLKAQTPVVVLQVPASEEHTTAGWEDEIQVGVVAQVRSRNADSPGGRLASPSSPAASVEIHFVTTGCLDFHVVVLGHVEKMAMIRGHNEALDPCLA